MNYKKIGKIIHNIKQKHPLKQITHLISIGGWNAPHISTDFTAQEWFDFLDQWNKNTVANEFFPGFDGFDFDLEGNDSVKSPFSKFTVKEVNLIGELSQLMKANGYIVSMAPAQSYFDYENEEFSLDVSFTPEWREKGSFPYAGKNVYSYVYSKYGVLSGDSLNTFSKNFPNHINTTTDNTIQTYDFVSIQLYEGWSRANHEIRSKAISPEKYLHDLIKAVTKGFKVNFSSEKEVEYEDSIVKVPLNNLVIGLANGWAKKTNGKMMILFKGELENVFRVLSKNHVLPKGFMFWDLKDEGLVVEDDYDEKEVEYFLVKYLKEFYDRYG